MKLKSVHYPKESATMGHLACKTLMANGAAIVPSLTLWVPLLAINAENERPTIALASMILLPRCHSVRTVAGARPTSCRTPSRRERLLTTKHISEFLKINSKAFQYSRQPHHTCFVVVAIRHRGCVCPPEFTGPHCEFLLHPDVVLEDVQSEIIDNGPVSETKRSFHIAATTMLGLALVLVVAVIFKKIRSRRPIPKEITVKSNPWVSQSRHYGGYRDSIYNGRHISSQSVNLRAGSRFGDESDFVDVQIT